MSKPNVIKIDDVEYVRSDMVKAPITGNRAVIVVDRGWIFAGDVTRENGRIKLSRAIHVMVAEPLDKLQDMQRRLKALDKMSDNAKELGLDYE